MELVEKLARAPGFGGIDVYTVGLETVLHTQSQAQLLGRSRYKRQAFAMFHFSMSNAWATEAFMLLSTAFECVCQRGLSRRDLSPPC